MSGPEWTITALPSASRKAAIEKRSVVVARTALPSSVTSRLGRSPACAPCVAPDGLKCPPAEQAWRVTPPDRVNVEPVEPGRQVTHAGLEQHNAVPAVLTQPYAARTPPGRGGT